MSLVGAHLVRSAGPIASRAGGRAGRLLPLIAVVLFVIHAAAFWHYVNDDAYITFRYARFLAEGLGPFFNVGEQVEGYTNFSWMVLLSAIFPLVGADSLPTAARVLGVLAQAGALLAASALTRRVLAWNSAALVEMAWMPPVITGLLVAMSPAIAINSTSGLETPLYSLCVTAGTLAAVIEAAGGGWRGSTLWLGLGALTRPEGVGIAAGVWLMRVALAASSARSGATRFGWRTLLADAIALAAIVGSHLAFRMLTYQGEWLPNTWYAKQGGFWAIRPIDYVAGAIFGPTLAFAGLALAGAGWVALVRRSPAVLVALGVAGAGLLFPLFTGSDWMLGYRLAVPYLPVLAALLVAGWQEVLRHFMPLRVAVLVGLLLTLPAGLLQRSDRADWLAESALRAQGYRTGHQELAAWLERNASPGDTVAMMDVGIVGYLNPKLRLIDTTGLTDRFIAKSPGTFLQKSYDPAYLFDQHPRFVVLTCWAEGTPYEQPASGTRFAPWTPNEARIADSPAFHRDYRGSHPVVVTGRWTDGLAEKLGARAVFEHAHPGLVYLLMVFERAADPGARDPDLPARSPR